MHSQEAHRCPTDKNGELQSSLLVTARGCPQAKRPSAGKWTQTTDTYAAVKKNQDGYTQAGMVSQEHLLHGSTDGKAKPVNREVRVLLTSGRWATGSLLACCTCSAG